MVICLRLHCVPNLSLPHFVVCHRFPRMCWKSFDEWYPMWPHSDPFIDIIVSLLDRFLLCIVWTQKELIAWTPRPDQKLVFRKFFQRLHQNATNKVSRRISSDQIRHRKVLVGLLQWILRSRKLYVRKSMLNLVVIHLSVHRSANFPLACYEYIGSHGSYGCNKLVTCWYLSHQVYVIGWVLRKATSGLRFSTSSRYVKVFEGRSPFIITIEFSGNEFTSWTPKSATWLYFE